ncbi:hypothetical protein AVEN_247642-1 [Araneus ventricosus]|uniref:RNase H type-1 domain-containing protein n=1 Tax=Araneus ventricosus TaxID=182803 RepID=A0A4Y2TIC0_ARAVE|nr:hypothetical protein AVEN_212535-1 [Araneus ventricosus]GBN99152.1 hypothetical protein AVEN_247642-1 [Araneus ventricosus]
MVLSAAPRDMSLNKVFYVVKTPDTFHKISPFVVHRFILSIVGEVFSIKKLSSGDLLIETANASQSQSFTHGHPFIRDIPRRNANFGRKEYDILFSWNPAHVGIVGNEIADAAAKSATEFHTHPLPLAGIRMFLRKWFLQSRQRKWDMETENKLHDGKPLLVKWSSSLSRRL